MLFYSGLESKNKQNTDNIKALQVTYLFPKFTLQPRAFAGFIVYFWSLAHKRFDMFPLCNLYEFKDNHEHHLIIDTFTTITPVIANTVANIIANTVPITVIITIDSTITITPLLSSL